MHIKLINLIRFFYKYIGSVAQSVEQRTENLCVSSFYTLHNSYNSLIYNDLHELQNLRKPSNLCYNLCYNSTSSGMFSLIIFLPIFVMLQFMLQCYNWGKLVIHDFLKSSFYTF